MIRDIETIGLKIENISPGNNEINFPVDGHISIKFNSYISKSTLANNVYLIHENTEERIPCSIKCYDDCIELYPKTLLINSAKYKISISNVSDILGRRMCMTYSSCFYTDSKEYIEKPSILEPLSIIYNENPIVRLSCKSKTCIIEISNTKAFNLILYEKLIECNEGETEHIIEGVLEEGMYYIRLRTEEEVFSNSVQFYISHSEGKISEDDYEIDESFDNNNAELKDFNPYKVSLYNNAKCIYYRFNGKIDIEKINSCKHYIKSEFIDTENTTSIEHGYVDYNMIYMYDAFESITYLIFELIEVS